MKRKLLRRILPSLLCTTSCENLSREKHDISEGIPLLCTSTLPLITARRKTRIPTTGEIVNYFAQNYLSVGCYFATSCEPRWNKSSFQPFMYTDLHSHGMKNKQILGNNTASECSANSQSQNHHIATRHEWDNFTTESWDHSEWLRHVSAWRPQQTKTYAQWYFNVFDTSCPQYIRLQSTGLHRRKFNIELLTWPCPVVNFSLLSASSQARCTPSPLARYKLQQSKNHTA